jgi:hypothetical protein
MTWLIQTYPFSQLQYALGDDEKLLLPFVKCPADGRRSAPQAAECCMVLQISDGVISFGRTSSNLAPPVLNLAFTCPGTFFFAQDDKAAELNAGSALNFPVSSAPFTEAPA